MKQDPKHIQRQIRYNMKTETGEQIDYRYKYIFLIINSPREIGIIKERIWREMAPIVDFQKIDSGIARNSGSLHYDLFSFSTDKGKIENPENIYNDTTRFSRDANLAEKMTDGLSLLMKV